MRLRFRSRDDAEAEITAAPAPTGARALAEADALASVSQLVEAVDLLVEANRAAWDPQVAVRLVELRREAAEAADPGRGREPWPPPYPDPFPHLVGGLPEIDAAHLHTELLGGAVAHHGSLLVRGLLDPDQVRRAVAGIDRARAEADRPNGDDPWYRPLAAPPAMKNQVLRNMVSDQGGIWLADSPACADIVLADLTTAGVVPAIAGHFGERPFFSLQKSTLRRSPPEFRLAAWHQDGSFLSPGVRTMNVWVALSRCGGDHPAPALEVVPRRIDEVLPVDGVMSPHSISYDLVDDLAATTPTVVPAFEPGDAMLFDERFVHRTHLTEDMTEPRYAIECWFFAPSHRSQDYAPLLV